MFVTFSRYLSVVPLGADHIFRLGKVRIIKNRVHLHYVFNCICVCHCISVFIFKPRSATRKKFELKRTGRAIALGWGGADSFVLLGASLLDVLQDASPPSKMDEL